MSMLWFTHLLMGCYYMYVVLLFFKQKTAYDMRISDWSSDVCSSDLQVGRLQRSRARSVRHQHVAGAAHSLQIARELRVGLDLAAQAGDLHVDGAGVAADRAFLAQVVAADRLAGPPRQRL